MKTNASAKAQVNNRLNKARTAFSERTGGHNSLSAMFKLEKWKVRLKK